MPGSIEKVDCAINVFGKPYQTALALLSLLRHSGAHIDTVYFIIEPNSAGNFDPLIARLPKVVCYTPRDWLWTNPVDPRRLGDDGYRLSIRYQYAWERSDKRYLFTTHNDCIYIRDIVGAMLAALYGTEPPAGRVKRRYDQPGFDPWFEREPWPLPECRINEWAAMIDLSLARPLTMPIGEALPFGAFSHSGSDTLDTGVAWFRGVSL